MRPEHLAEAVKGLVRLGFVFALVACAPMGETARTKFARAAVCPDDRVAVEETDSTPARRPPPPHIGGDPERIAAWNAREDERIADAPSRTLYVARGCGEKRVYTCWHPRRNHLFTTECEELAETAPVPVPVRPWTQWTN